jgi:Zn-dependent protease with chaperone function
MEVIQLAPLPYHEAIRDYLKREESRVWDWFASHSAREEQAEVVRFDLLKNTYRIERDADSALYVLADDVAAVLGIELPITIYQSQNPEGLNAAIAYVPDEVHIVFSGPLKAKLSEPEIRAVLAHELTHHGLWRSWNGEFLIADQILAALTHDAHAHSAHFASARLFQLYLDIYRDRGSLAVTRDPFVVVSTLVKIATGLDEIRAEGYIRQAEEVYRKGLAKTAGLTHPETFIRARAIKLWHDRDEHAADKIAAMIEGPLALNELDLLGQRKVHDLTHRMVDALLAPRWLQSELLLAHARLYFPEYSPPGHKPSDEQLVEALRTEDRPLQDYFCYVLLDFATADRELEEAPLAAALRLAERADLKVQLAEIAKKELRLTKKQFERIDREKESLIEFAAREARTA